MARDHRKPITYKDAATEALLQAMEKDEKVFLMGEGVDNITGVYGQVLPAYKKFGPSRVIDTPLSENGLTGFAIGAALDGMRPVLIHQRNDFMLLAMDQMMNQAAKLRYASGGHHKVPLTILSFVARRPGEGVQHSHSLQSVFAHFPGIKVGMPASAVDAKGMLLSAIFDDDPVIILEHRHNPLFEKKEFVPERYYETPFTSNIVVSGQDITIVTVSIALLNAIEASGEFNAKGIYPEIMDLRWLRPIDINPIIQSIKKTGRLLVVDTGWRSCSISSEIVALVAERAHGYLKCPPRRITLPDTPCPASQYLEPYYHPTTEAIIQVVKEMV
ncbi:MAG: transketolase C-terminal domain-containing protein [Candidatus Azambacteria bacterium]|nr:transketolase C-terminal domain-containing protein [Candidatus Azambacteria bacterium]